MSDKISSDYEFPLKKVQIHNWLLLGVMIPAGWLIYSADAALGILVGGVLSCGSFEFLKNDLTRLMKGPLNLVKGRFFIKYYARFSVLAVVLFCIIKYGSLNLGGLLVGLTTVVISIGVTVAAESKKIFFNLKEAS